jgi:hypothetical protein
MSDFMLWGAGYFAVAVLTAGHYARSSGISRASLLRGGVCGLGWPLYWGIVHGLGASIAVVVRALSIVLEAIMMLLLLIVPPLMQIFRMISECIPHIIITYFYVGFPFALFYLLSRDLPGEPLSMGLIAVDVVKSLFWPYLIFGGTPR